MGAPKCSSGQETLPYRSQAWRACHTAMPCAWDSARCGLSPLAHTLPPHAAHVHMINLIQTQATMLCRSVCLAYQGMPHRRAITISLDNQGQPT